MVERGDGETVDGRRGRQERLLQGERLAADALELHGPPQRAAHLLEDVLQQREVRLVRRRVAPAGGDGRQRDRAAVDDDGQQRHARRAGLPQPLDGGARKTVLGRPVRREDDQPRPLVLDGLTGDRTQQEVRLQRRQGRQSGGQPHPLRRRHVRHPVGRPYAELHPVLHAEDGHGVGQLGHHGRRRRQERLGQIVRRRHRRHPGQQLLAHPGPPVALGVGGRSDPLHLPALVHHGRGDDLDVAEAVGRAVEPYPDDRVERRPPPGGPAPGPLEPAPVLRMHGVHPRAAVLRAPQLLRDAAPGQQSDDTVGRHHPHRLRHGRHERLVPPEEMFLVHRRLHLLGAGGTAPPARGSGPGPGGQRSGSSPLMLR